MSIVGERALPPGPCTLRFEFRKTGPRRGTGTLLVDGQAVGTVDLPKTWPVVGVTAGLHCGRAGQSPVSDAYRAPAPFTGTLRRVVVELGDDGQHDLAAEYEGALAEE
jgi:arylsulfatase